MSTIGKFNLAQINGLLRNKPRYTDVRVTGMIALPTEILEGDQVSVGDSTAITGYPIAQTTLAYKLAGVSQGASYQTKSGDAGKSILVEKTIANSRNSVVVDSNAVTIGTGQGFADMGYVGGNVESTGDYQTSPLFRNALSDGRGWGYTGLFGTTPLAGGTSGVTGGVLALTQVSGLSYTLAFTSFNTNPLMNNANDVGRVVTITLSGVVYTATITAFGANSAGTSSCTATLSATPTALTGITTWSVRIKLDSNGWPMQKAELVVTSSPGQLPGGVTYQMTVKSLNPALTITSVSSAATFWNGGHPTPSNTMNFPGVLDVPSGITTYTFSLTFSAGQSLILDFSDGITFGDLPRDGSATSYDTGSIFNPNALAFYAGFSSLRLMDFMSTNGKLDTDWTTRTQPAVCQPRPLSLEVTIDFCNAVYEYPGSKVKQVWLNIGGLCTVAPGNAHSGTSYVENLISLANTWNSGKYGYSGLNSNLLIAWEYGNEPWNFAFNLWAQNSLYGQQELQMLSTSNWGNGAAYPIVTGLTVSAGTATATCSGTAPAFVTNGASMLCSTDSNYWQGLDIHAAQANLASPSVISNVTQGAGFFTFTFPVGSTNSASSLVGSASRWAIVFNLTSTLAQDQAVQPAANQAGGVCAFYNVTIKWMVRQAWRVKQILQQGGVGGAKRPNDRVVLNLQQYGTSGPGGNNSSPLHYAYGQWLDSAGNSENAFPNAQPSLGNWLYGTAIAPYVSPNIRATWVGGTNQVTNVTTAAAFAVGDTVAVKNGNINSLSQAGVTLLSAYLRSVVTGINGNVITLADHAGGSTAMTPGSKVVVLATGGGSAATLGDSGIGVMYEGDNVLSFTTPIAGLTVGDTLGVHNAGQYPLNTTVVAARAINLVSTFSVGSAYTNGTYPGVPLTGGSGSGAIATVVIAGGQLSTVTMTTRGSGYAVNDVLSFAAASVGGTGSGASTKVVGLTTILQDFAYVNLAGAIVGNGLNNVSAPGTGYTDGTYTGVALTNVSSAGASATATIVVLGGVVTSATIVGGGSGYVVGDILSVSSASIGGGSGFQVTVTAAANAYITATSGSAVGQKSLCVVSQNNVFVNSVSLSGLANGDSVTIIGAGNPALYTSVTAVDGVNNILTLARPIAAQQILSTGVFTSAVTSDTLLMTGVNPASIVKALMINLKSTDDLVRAHVTQCKLAGVHPLAYEGGPDTQCIPLWQNEIHTYADATYGIGAFCTALLDVWFQNGGEHFHFFTLGPSAFSDSSIVPNSVGSVSPGSVGAVIAGGYLSQTCWSIAQSFADVTAPKFAAVSTYNPLKWYQNTMTYPTTYGSALQAVPRLSQNRYNLTTIAANTYQRVDAVGVATTVLALTSPAFSGTSIISWLANTVSRLVTFTIPVPRSGKYLPVIQGTDTIANTQAQLLIDGVLQGATQTLPVLGSGAVAAATPGPATGAAPVNLTSGVHLFQVNLPAGTGSANVGIYTVSLTLVQ